MKSEPEFNRLQKVMLINAHPVKNTLNFIGGAVGCYFLWQHNGLFAIIFGAGIIITGTLMATVFRKMDHKKLAATFWGRFFLIYSTATGFPLYLISHIVIPYAFWIHSIKVGILGLILLSAGFLFNIKVFRKY